MGIDLNEDILHKTLSFNKIQNTVRTGLCIRASQSSATYSIADTQKYVYLHTDTMDMESIDTTNLCSHLQKKLFEKDGVYHPIWAAVLEDPSLTAVVRSRQLHIYRNGKKVLVLAGKAAPKVIREDTICAFLPKV